MTVRDLGLVSQVFDESKLRALAGDMAIGHVRYSTTGSSAWENAQPIYRSDVRDVALAHNGNLINAVELHSEMREQGVEFRSTSDSEIIAALLSTHPADTIQEAIADVVPRLEGAFSTVVMTPEGVFAFRDPAGPAAAGARPDRRPLLRRLRVAARSTSSAPSSCARCSRARWSASGRAASRRKIVAERPAPGVLRLRAHLLRAARLAARGHAAPRSRAGGWARSSGASRRSRPTSSCRCPDSGTPAAGGFAWASGIPRDDALVKNRYVARTFIQPGQELRKHGLRMKFNPLPEIVSRQAAGRRRRLDRARQHHAPDHPDAARRGRDRGPPAHLGAADPAHVPLRRRHVDDGGDDRPRRTEAEIAEELGADSLAYLSLEGLYEAIEGERATHCDACFTGDYPLERTEHAQSQVRARRARRRSVLAAPVSPRAWGTHTDLLSCRWGR